MDEKNIEFLMENLEDTAQDVAEKFKLMGRSMANATENINAYATGVAETLQLSGVDIDTVMSMSAEELEELLKSSELTEEQIA
jgi:hypothetical protein